MPDMRPKLLAIVIDGPNMVLLEQWLSDGSLPVIGALMQNGATGRHHHVKQYRNERCWDLWLSGKKMDAAGAMFDAASYAYFQNSLQREDRYEPFFALGEQFRVCAFDLPATISANAAGVQVTGWGSEMNVSAPLSSPPELIDEILERHGPDPKVTRRMKVRDHPSGQIENSYTIPNLYNPCETASLCDKLILSAMRRADICLDLMQREDWDLFLVNFPEIHSANHLLWHLSEAHPMNRIAPSRQAMRAVFQAIDAAIGRLQQAWPTNGTVMLTTIDHTTSNAMDLPSMALLPEVLYRWNCPGKALLAPGAAGTPVAPYRFDYQDLWKHEIWRLTTAQGREQLISPAELEACGDPMSWHPAVWYRNLWPQLTAFALPSVSDGHIRLNVAGREREGCIAPEDYAATLDALSTMLSALIDPRSGQRAVARLERTRSAPDDAPHIPPDLIVCWQSNSPLDCIDSSQLGRVGPLPFFRTGGHVAHGSPVEGLAIIAGPTIAPGSRLEDGNLEDIPATMLALMGAPRPQAMTGRSLLASNALAD